MTKDYIGIKKVTAWEQEGKDGQPGYAVKYEDGYTSWSPKDVFEKFYYPLADGHNNKISQEDVAGFVAEAGYDTAGQKTTVMHATLKNRFEMVESSSCVDPANYDEHQGADICMQRVKDKVWLLLGFALQWAVYGVNYRPDESADPDE